MSAGGFSTYSAAARGMPPPPQQQQFNRGQQHGGGLAQHARPFAGHVDPQRFGAAQAPPQQQQHVHHQQGYAGAPHHVGVRAVPPGPGHGDLFSLKPAHQQYALQVIERHREGIVYSPEYFDDECAYRHVILPQAIADFLPSAYLLNYQQWRAFGIAQRTSWQHFLHHRPEPRILVFRRPLEPQEMEERDQRRHFEQRAKSRASAARQSLVELAAEQRHGERCFLGRCRGSDLEQHSSMQTVVMPSSGEACDTVM